MGDKGGVNIIIKYHGRYSNLHKFWDNLCHLEKKFEVAADLDLRYMNVSDYVDQDVRFSGDFKEVERWMNQSYNLAVQYIYDDNILKNGLITNDYVKMCKKICHQQIVLGGLRLASVLDYIWKVLKKPHNPHKMQFEQIIL